MNSFDAVGRLHTPPARGPLALGVTLAFAALSQSADAATVVPISGEIQRITLNTPGDHWSGGVIEIGGQAVIIPRNLLIDLPANRLTLQELFAQAPATCQASGESGLAKADACNVSGTGGFATLSANRTNAGNVIAGDVLIEKGTEAVTGVVTYIDYTDGYFRVNGNGDAASGTMVRLNDPDGRHTLQQGLGCAAGNTVNCSADPRFTLDPDNYTAAFTTGYPVCLPSSSARAFTDTLDLNQNTDTGETLSAQAGVGGGGDLLCPSENRAPTGVAADSRRFAPLQVGDSVSAEGNFENVGGTQFLSAHTLQVMTGLATRNDPTQPDYLFLEEVEIDVAGFQNQRARTLIIGFTTLPSDVTIWGIHYDPAGNRPHEVPLASSSGCDLAAGPGECTAQGLGGGANNIFKIRHDVDFGIPNTKARLDPCQHLRAAGFNACPTGNLAEQFGVLSPVPHEIQARTAHALQNPGLVTLDVRGNAAPNGQYLFPLGMNLGGISTPEFVEIDLNQVATPFIFEGIPWNLDRRLSPGGCIDSNGDGAVDCEATAQPLDPFPFSGLDPRTQAQVPGGTYNDPLFTSSPLTRTANRILSYISPTTGLFDGRNTVLPWPPLDPPFVATAPVQPVLICSAPPPPVNAAPIITSTPATTATAGIRYEYVVSATDPEGTAVLYSLAAAPAGMLMDVGGAIRWRPTAAQAGTQAVTVRATDAGGMSAAQDFTITVAAQPVGPDVLAVNRAQYTAATATWSVAGTSSIPDANATVRVRVGPNLTGTLIGSAKISANGTWSVIARNSAVLPDLTNNSVSIESSNGGSLLAAPVTPR